MAESSKYLTTRAFSTLTDEERAELLASWPAITSFTLAGMLIYDPGQATNPPAWHETNSEELDDDAAFWRDKCSGCADAAARASGALRLSDNETAVVISCGAEADDFEDVALSINPDAVIENVDGDDIVVMPTVEAHQAFVAWCAKHAHWD